MRWEHIYNGDGACRKCGGISCPKFHTVGEGHSRAAMIVAVCFLGGVAALLIAAAVRYFGGP